VINVHRRIALLADHDCIGKPFKRPFLLVGRRGPSKFISRFTCLTFTYKAEQIFAPADAHKWITFQVKENVYGRRLREQRNAMLVGDFKYQRRRNRWR